MWNKEGEKNSVDKREKKPRFESVFLNLLTNKLNQAKLSSFKKYSCMTNPAIEEPGLIPRSIIRTLERLGKQVRPGSEMLALEEFRISRYRVIVSVRCLLLLFLVPLVVNLVSKSLFLPFLSEYFWNHNQKEIFLNSYQPDRAFTELQCFQENLYFDSLVENQVFQTHHDIGAALQQKTSQLANKYNTESIQALTTFFGDFLSFVSLSLVFVFLRPQISILKSFLAESFYSLNDTTKSFLLILGSNLLVGFHSRRGWEIFIKWFFSHFGLPESEQFMCLFVATFPVFLDTVFKYWIFRSLNEISPSTVATYHRMIE